MSSNHLQGDNPYKGEVKFKQFTAAVEKALKNFEGLTEWHDLISALARINKVLLAYMQYPVVPMQLTVCKRLTQCLHPNLPSGVHVKTLHVYTAIFDRIGRKGLLTNLLVYSSGLFPLLSYASMSVRPHLLAVLEKYFLPLGRGLVPALHGLVLSLLPGLEDESEHSERIGNLLNAISEVTDEASFFYALWQCVLGSPDYRLPAVTFLLGRIDKKVSVADQVHCLGGSLPLVVSGVCAALRDKNVLVQRTVLDVIMVLFPFHASFLLPEDLVAILTIALETLLKRDASLSRRFYSWLLGPFHSSAKPPPPSVANSSSSAAAASFTTSSYPTLSGSTKRNGEAKMHLPLSKDNPKKFSSYFEQHSKGHLSKALGKVLDNAGNVLHRVGAFETTLTLDVKVECVLPYRMLRVLHDRPEVSHLIMESVMLDLVRCLQGQLNFLGGLSSSPATGTTTTSKSETKSQPLPSGSQKKSGKRGSLKAEIVQSASLLMATLGRDFVWQWMEHLMEELVTSLLRRSESGAAASRSKGDQLAGGDGDIGMGGRVTYVGLDEVGGAGGRRADVRAVSPISELLETQLAGTKTRRGKAGLEGGCSTHRSLQDRDRGRTAHCASRSRSFTRRPSGQPSLLEVLALLSLILQVLPKDLVQGMHVCRLLAQLASFLHSVQQVLSARELAACLHLITTLLQDNSLKTPVSSSSAGSTPSVPSSSSPSLNKRLSPVNLSSSSGSEVGSSAGGNMGRSSVSKTCSPTQSLALGLSMEELKLKLYEEYLGFFAGFVSRHVLKSLGGGCSGLSGPVLCHVFSHACQGLILMARSLARSQVFIHAMEEDSRTLGPLHHTQSDWLSHLVQVCRLGGLGCQEDEENSPKVTGRHPGTSPDVEVWSGLRVEVWLVGVETLLTLLEMAVQAPPSQFPAPEPFPSPLQVTSCSSLLSLEEARKSVFTQDFVKTLSSHLWGLLSADRLGFHAQAAPLLGLLRSLVTWNSSCETYLLDQFSTKGLDAHQRFAALWHYLPTSYHGTRIVPFYRATLRMLEGLHSSDTATLSVTRSWVKTVMSGGSSNGSLTRLLQPALKILLDPKPLRKPAHEKLGVRIALSREDAKKDMEYARYYFQSLGIENPYAPSKKEQYSELVVYYSQPVDSSQLLYATSLLQSVMAVEPEMFVCAAGNVMVDVSSLTGTSGTNESIPGIPVHSQGGSSTGCGERSDYFSSLEKSRESGGIAGRKLECDDKIPPSPSPATTKSLLELLLSVCVDMLRSEYHPTLKTSAPDQLENLKVKVTSSSLLSTVLHELLKVLAGKKKEVLPGVGGGGTSSTETGGGGGREWKVSSPSFVSALVALCDVQQVALLLLGRSLQWWGEAFCSSAMGDEYGRRGTGKMWASVAAAGLEASSSGMQARCNLLGVALRSLYCQLLRAVQCLVVLDSQLCMSLEGGETRQHQLHQQASSFSYSSKPDLVTVSSGITLPNDSRDSTKPPHSLPAVIPSVLTASQPYFKAFLLVVLSSSSLSSFHDDLLHMFTATLSNLLHQQVLELAPNLFKQLCTNIERSVSLSTQHGGSIAVEIEDGRGLSLQNSHLCVAYMKSLLGIIHWSLFRVKTEEKSVIRPLSSVSRKPGFISRSQLRNTRYDIFQVVQTRFVKENHSPTLKQPSAMSWLLGVFSASQKPLSLPGLSGSGSVMGGATGEGGGGVMSDGVPVESTGHPSHGVDSLVGQHVLMLLPAVYNAMAALWTHLGLGVGVAKKGDVEGQGASNLSSSSYKESLLVEDMEWLFHEILCSLAETEPTAFFSSVSHIWLEWNISNKSDERSGRSGGGGGAGGSYKKKDRDSLGVRQKQESFIEILHHVKVLPLEVLLHCLQSTLVEIGKVEDYESGLLRQQYLLHFLYKYISSSLQSSKELADSRVGLVAFLKDYHSQVYNPTPQALVRGCSILCMLISILHVLICRVPPPNIKTQKKERKDLQDVCHKLCETLSMVANVGLVQPDYVMVEATDSSSLALGGEGGLGGGTLTATGSRADSKKPGLAEPSVVRNGLLPSRDGTSQELQSEGSVSPSLATNGATTGPNRHGSSGSSSLADQVRRGSLEESDGSGSERSSVKGARGKRKLPVSVELLQPALQALTVLSNVLAHFIDSVFDSSEKDKVTTLLKAVLLNVWPHLHNHSHDFHDSHTQSSKLLASLSGFQVTRKSWRKEAFDLFLAPDFFSTTLMSLREWKVIVDNLMTQDQVTFRDLLSRLHSTSSSGVVNIFSSLDQEISSGRILLRRVAFALLSGEVDQYVKFLPDIQEKLSEYLRVLRYPSICCEIFLTFRVLLLKFSPHHLLSFWPAMTAELISQLGQLESDLKSVEGEGATLPSVPPSRLQLYLAACKLLDTALALPPQMLPHFQWLRWGFVATESDELIVSRLCKLFQITDMDVQELRQSSDRLSPPFLGSCSVSSLQDLKPFFAALNSVQLSSDSQTRSSHSVHWKPIQSSSTSTVIDEVVMQDFLESLI